MFIVFEGLDGVGKDTQLRKVFTYLTEKFKYAQVCKTQEPSGISKSGKEISYKLKNGGFESPKEALDLYISDRVEMNGFKSIIKENNGIVLCSRGDYTAYAYQSISQGDKKGFSFDEIYNRHNEISNDKGEKLLIPDLTFYFELPIDKVMERIDKRLKHGEEKDFFEKKDFLELASNQYIKTIEYLRKKQNREIHIINAEGSEDIVFNNVISILEKYIIDNKITF